MAMFMPSQSHSGGVIVKPYIQATVRKNCNFSLEKTGKTCNPILRLVCPVINHCKRLLFESSNLLWCLIYLIDLVVDNLFWCFTFQPTQHTVSLKTKSLIVCKFRQPERKSSSESPEMTSAQVFETSVSVTNNSSSWDQSHTDEQTIESPGFKLFTALKYLGYVYSTLA